MWRRVARAARSRVGWQLRVAGLPLQPSADLMIRGTVRVAPLAVARAARAGISDGPGFSTGANVTPAQDSGWVEEAPCPARQM
jgi:hypothetical protein